MDLKCKNGTELLNYALSFEKAYSVDVQHSTKEAFRTYISTTDIIDTFKHYGNNTKAAIKHIDQYIEHEHYQAMERYNSLIGGDKKDSYINKFPNRDYSVNRKQRRLNEKNKK